MIKIAAMFWLAAVAVAAIGLFHVKYEVQRLESELKLEHRAILEDQEAVHVLKAEWSFLNRPGRLTDLASRHLGMAPLAPAQIVQIENLPLRQAPAEEHPVPLLPEHAPGLRPLQTGADAFRKLVYQRLSCMHHRADTQERCGGPEARA